MILMSCFPLCFSNLTRLKLGWGWVGKCQSEDLICIPGGLRHRGISLCVCLSVCLYISVLYTWIYIFLFIPLFICVYLINNIVFVCISFCYINIRLLTSVIFMFFASLFVYFCIEMCQNKWKIVVVLGTLCLNLVSDVS